MSELIVHFAVAALAVLGAAMVVLGLVAERGR